MAAAISFDLAFLFPRFAHWWCAVSSLCNAITRQLIELQSCSNPLRIQQVLKLGFKKHIFLFRSGDTCGRRHKCFFCVFWPLSPGPGRQSIKPFFGWSLFLETRSKSSSLEPLNGFLAYLEPKWWIKKQKLVKLWGGLHPNLGWITPIF